MKNIFIILLLFTFSVNSFTQNKPEKNALGFGVDVSLKSLGSIPTFRLDYYINNRNSLKLFYKPSYSMSEIENRNDSDDGTRTSTSQIFQGVYSMQLGLGYERHFLPKSKFDPFIGLNIAYLYSGKSKEINAEQNTYDYLGTQERYETKSVNTGVERHGVNSSIIIGGNYFILKNLSLGAEFSIGYSFSQQKGENVNTREEYYYVDDILISESSEENKFDLNYSTKGVIYNASIKAAYFFSFSKKKQSE